MRGVTFCGEIDTPADLDADGSGSTSRSVRVCPAVERRQCFDLPPAAVEVTEHQLVERECGCGQRTKGTASDGVDAPVQYGPRIAAIIVYAGQFLPEKRTAQALAELFAIPLSSGTVAALTARAAARLDGFPEEIRARIAAAGVAGFDETGLRAEGRLRWVHCARTGKYILLSCHPRRGTEAMNAMGVLPGFAGVDLLRPGALRHLRGPRSPALLRPCRPRAPGRRRPGPGRAVVPGDPGRRGAHRHAAPGS
jgi:transposase